MRLNNKVALITGAAGEIGAATAKRFLEEGASVMLADINADALSALASSLGSDKVGTVTVDVTDEASNKAMIEATLAQFGQLDIFVANAGTESKISAIEDYDTANFDRVMAINVRGPYLGIKHAVPALKQNGGGSIIITSSGAGVKGSAQLTAYNTSKHAVVGMMRCLALELGPYNIRVNTINPGPIKSRMMSSISAGFQPVIGDAFDDAVTAATPLGRYGLPAEMAPLMAFLASDDASYCTGAVYMADGGNSAG
jgi:NAD(P)-dependent dehydrogenase (short-subunit alcohol dehydrogenase family)